MAHADHSHPHVGSDVLTWGEQAATNFSGGNESGGMSCGTDNTTPSIDDCSAFRDNMLAGEYQFVGVRVARFNDNSPADADAVAVSGCSLFPGIPGGILTGTLAWDAACYATSADESNNFNQFQVWLRIGSASPWMRIRLPSYNSHGIRDISVSVIGVR